MKLALIGRSMISPFGFAMSPRMPASWRICVNEPRAPELAIMKIGFSSSSEFSIASATVSVASVQRFTMISCRSSSVIRPRACWSSTVFTRASKPWRISSFSGGMTTSFFDTEIPARVAYVKPRLLIVSSTGASAGAPYTSTSSAMKSPMAFLSSVWLMNSWPDLALEVDGLGERAVDLRVEDHAAAGGDEQLAVPLELDRILEADLLRVERELDVLLRAVPARTRLHLLRVGLAQVIRRST